MFRRRFWSSLLLSIPVIATSQMVMDWFGYQLDFPGIDAIGPVLGTVLFLWAGWPFLHGGWNEARSRQPGLMLLIAATGRGAGALLATVTAFTVAHSLTLGLATIGDITLPGGAVEAVIALSILLLAVELARLRPGAPPATLTQRFPWLVAFGFGLLHGFGFAGALAEIGLPPDAQWRALLLFNLGVEAGQLGVIALLVLGARLLHATTLLARVTRLATTAIGAVAAFWLLDRLQPVVGL